MAEKSKRMLSIMLIFMMIIAVIFPQDVYAYNWSKCTDEVYAVNKSPNEFESFANDELPELNIDDIKFNANKNEMGVQNFESSIFYKFVLKKDGMGENTRIKGAKNCVQKSWLPYMIEKNSGVTHRMKDVVSVAGGDDIKLQMRVRLDDELQYLAQKGDLQVGIMSKLYSEKRGDHANIKIDEYREDMYLSGSEIDSSAQKWIDGYSTGWCNVNQMANILELYYNSTGVRSAGDGVGMSDTRVYLRDAVEPEIMKIRIDALNPAGKIKTNEVDSSTTYDGKTGIRANIGDTLRYTVEFDEPIELNSDNIWLTLNTKSGNVAKADFVGAYTTGGWEWENDGQDWIEKYSSAMTDSALRRLVFEYKILDMTSTPDKSVQVWGDVKDLMVPGSASIKDRAGNEIKTVGQSNSKKIEIGSKYYKDGKSEYNPNLGIYKYKDAGMIDTMQIFENKNITVDDTATLLSDENYLDIQNGGFFPKKTNYYLGEYLFGEMPDELILPNGYDSSVDEFNQPTEISVADNQQGAIFRVLLNDEMKKSDMIVGLNPLKLKLQVYDAKTKESTGKYVEAELVGSRIVVSKSDAVNNSDRDTQGINGDKFTELLFRYKPKAVDFTSQNLNDEIYYIDIKGDYEDNDFVFANDVFNQPIFNISNMQIGINSNNSSKLKLPPAEKKVKRSPLNLATNPISIDTKGPELVQQTITEKNNIWSKSLPSGSVITLKDENGIESAELSIVGYTNGERIAVSIAPSVLSELEARTSLTVNSVKNDYGSYDLNLSGITVKKGVPLNEDGTDNATLYLEYKVYDGVGNLSTNQGLKNIPVKLDATAPTVVGTDITITDNDVVVDYDVRDFGSGEIDNELFYKIEENISSSLPSGNSKTGNNDEQKIKFAGSADAEKTYQVWAKFSDIAGNTMPEYFPTGPINITNRTFDFSLEDSASRVSKVHNVKLKVNKRPDDSEDYLILVAYKWIPQGINENTVKPKTWVITPDKMKNDVIDLNFSSDEEQQYWMEKSFGKNMTDGKFINEMQFVAEATMLKTKSIGENLKTTVKSGQESIRGTYYFDCTAPNIEWSVYGDNIKGYNSKYKLAIDITDDGGQYFNGLFTLGENIGFDTSHSPYVAGGAPMYEVLVGDDKVETNLYGYLDSTEFKTDIDMNNIKPRFGGIPDLSDETEAYLRITATDLFGNVNQKITSQPILFDIKAPVISSIVPQYKDGKTESKDYVRYSPDTNLYVVKNIIDTVENFKIKIIDNVEDKMYIRYKDGDKIYQGLSDDKVLSRIITTDSPMYSSFDNSNYKGQFAYQYNVLARDMSGNTVGKNILFIEDTTAPSVYSVFGEAILTNERAKDIEIYYSKDKYELPSDITVEIQEDSGLTVKEITDSKIILTATKNVDTKIVLKDRVGNTISRAINITCFDYGSPQIEIKKDDNPENSTTGVRKPVKQGELILSVTDDREISKLYAALVEKDVAVSDTDYFQYTKIYPTTDENVLSEVKITELTEDASILDKRYKIEYRGVPTGNYDLYIKAQDKSGNSTVIRTDISCSLEPPNEPTVTYLPETATGGQAIIKVNTNEPTYLSKTENIITDDVLSNVVAGIQKARADGFTYVFEGVEKHLTTYEALCKFDEISEKYKNKNKENAPQLTAEEEMLVQYYAKNHNNLEDKTNYYNLLIQDISVPKKAEPVGDMADFIYNKLFIPFVFAVPDYSEEHIYEPINKIAVSSDNIIKIENGKAQLGWYETADIDVQELLDFAKNTWAMSVMISDEKYSGIEIDISKYPEDIDIYDTELNMDKYSEKELLYINILQRERKRVSMSKDLLYPITMSDLGYLPDERAKYENEIVNIINGNADLESQSELSFKMSKYLDLFVNNEVESGHEVVFDINNYPSYIDLFDTATDNIQKSYDVETTTEIVAASGKNKVTTNQTIDAATGIKTKIITTVKFVSRLTGNTIINEYGFEEAESITEKVTTVETFIEKPKYTQAELNAIEKIQRANKRIFERITGNYIKFFGDMSGDVQFKNEHYLSYKQNTQEKLYLIDEIGQKTDFDIDISNIQTDRPYIEDKNIKVTETNGDEILSYTNSDSVTFAVDNSDIDSAHPDKFDNYLMYDLKDKDGNAMPLNENKSLHYATVTDKGAVIYVDESGYIASEGTITTAMIIKAEGISEETDVASPVTTDLVIAAGTKLYRKISSDVSENGPVSFKVINIAMLGDEFKQSNRRDAIAEQYYLIDVIDREEPKGEIIYLSGGNKNNPVTSDVEVKLINYSDDKSLKSRLIVNKEAYTFTQNGTTTFTIADEAGNVAEISARVDYIDKEAPNINVELYVDEKPVKTKSRQTTVTYDGNYTNKPVTAVITVDGVVRNKYVFEYNDSLVFNYTKSNKLSSNIKIVVDKIDKIAPQISGTVKLSETKTTSQPVTATLRIKDDKTRIFSMKNLVSQSSKYGKIGRVEFANNMFSVKFADNDEALLTFKDDAGNTLDVEILVSNIDKTMPKLCQEVRTSITSTYKDVTVVAYPNKDVKFKITDKNGNIIMQDWSDNYTLNPVSYVFENNGVIAVTLEDRAGNISQPYIIAVNNIDKVKPELSYEVMYDKAVDKSGKLIDYCGAATIKLSVKDPLNSHDQFTGGTVTDENGKSTDTIVITNRDNAIYHTVMKNGTYSFMYSDFAGNNNKLMANVTDIDKNPPSYRVTGNPTEWTKDDAIITITPTDKKDKGKAYILIDGVKKEKYTITAKQNTEYSFVIVDDSNNSIKVNLPVTFIDKDAPIITYDSNSADVFYKLGKYSLTEKTKLESEIHVEDKLSGIKGDVVINYYNYDSENNKVHTVIDGNVSGKYYMEITAEDNAGNIATLTRKIEILNDTDIIPLLNGVELIPNSQIVFNSTNLKLEVLNAEQTGDIIVYCFEKGYFNEAQMKNSVFPKTMSSTGQVILEPTETGIYTLFIQTKDGQTKVFYVYIEVATNNQGGI